MSRSMAQFQADWRKRHPDAKLFRSLKLRATYEEERVHLRREDLKRLWESIERRCAECGGRVDEDTVVFVRSNVFGAYVIDNLAIICRSCNREAL